jgi:hypothetical protein
MFSSKQMPLKLPKIYNTVQQWSDTDNKVNYLKYQPNPYTETAITYTYNECGFRSDSFELDSELSVVFLGCSISEGIGLPLNEVWCHLAVEKLRAATGKNIAYWNLSMAGCGLDTCVRAYYAYAEQLKPQYVFALFPGYRREFYFNNNWNLAHLRGKDNIFEQNPILLNYETIQYETEKNLAMLNLLLEKHNTKLIWDTWDDLVLDKLNIPFTNACRIKKYNDILKKNYISKARDGSHPGKNFHSEFGNAMFDQWLNKSL